ncbi:MAG: penicillin-binding protein 2 [Hyphomicrobiaceae bacterium]
MTPSSQETPGPVTTIEARRERPVERSLVVLFVLMLAFLGVAAQLVRLALLGIRPDGISVVQPLTGSWSRPDIVDRNGRLIATDVLTPSLYADPARVLDADEVVEKLRRLVPDLDIDEVRAGLADRTRRFLWIKRGMTPRLAQQVHDLGLPGLGFRRELRRAYPQGALAAHLLGGVDVDNRGQSGIERYIDEVIGVELAHGSLTRSQEPLRLSIDLGVQFAVRAELGDALRRYKADAAAALVLDIDSGEILAASSLPDFDPNRPADRDPRRDLDRLTAGTYELGSIMKLVTVARHLASGGSLDRRYDTAKAIKEGRFTITDPHPADRPLSVREIFVRSSNVGAALLALEAGPQQQRDFLTRSGVLARVQLETGKVAAPQVPARWERIETITIGYGHGIAVAPMQFAAAAAALLNGGRSVQPTWLKRSGDARPAQGPPVIPPAASARLLEIMRLNVTSASGTGRRADAPGYEVGGKTGTAELAVAKGYSKSRVISSFLAVFPASRPRYLVLTMIFEPKPTPETASRITASVNAAPVTGRLIGRIAPLLGVLPRTALRGAGRRGH